MSERAQRVPSRIRMATTLGLFMRNERLKACISQEELAEAIGIDRTYPSLLERGLRSPTLDVARVEKVMQSL